MAQKLGLDVIHSFFNILSRDNINQSGFAKLWSNVSQHSKLSTKTRLHINVHIRWHIYKHKFISYHTDTNQISDYIHIQLQPLVSTYEKTIRCNMVKESEIRCGLKVNIKHGNKFIISNITPVNNIRTFIFWVVGLS